MRYKSQLSNPENMEANIIESASSEEILNILTPYLINKFSSVGSTSTLPMGNIMKFLYTNWCIFTPKNLTQIVAIHL